MLYLLSTLYFCLLLSSICINSIFGLLSISLLLGTYGLATWHELVHKHKLFNMSVCWKHHRKHHSSEDVEYEQRKRYTMPTYALIRTINYILDIKNYSLLDFALLLLAIFNFNLTLVIILSLFVTENIGYLQHNINNEPINFTNKFDNFIAFGAGYHAKHHSEISKHETDTQIFLGLFAAYIWFAISIFLVPILILSIRRSNIPGAYLFGFLQNVANYKAIHGNSVNNLLYRMPSIFDNPKILLQYVGIMFRKEKISGLIKRIKKNHFKNSHCISAARNIYNKNTNNNSTSVLIFNNEIVEGHHRHSAGVKNLQYFEIY